MTIATLDQYIAAPKQVITFYKTASRAATAAMPESLIALAGNPAAGSLNPGDTTNGLVPTDATAEYPTINPFGAGALGYISKVDFGNTVPCRIALYDRLWVFGAMGSDGAGYSPIASPSWASRVPGGTDFKGLQLWLEAVTAHTGASINFTWFYTNQDGTTGKEFWNYDTGFTPILGRCRQLPLLPGDSGLRTVDYISIYGPTTGTSNLMVLRPLWSGRVTAAQLSDSHNLLKTGLVQIFEDSALYVLITPDSTATGIPWMNIEVVNG